MPTTVLPAPPRIFRPCDGPVLYPSLENSTTGIAIPNDQQSNMSADQVYENNVHCTLGESEINDEDFEDDNDYEDDLYDDYKYENEEYESLETDEEFSNEIEESKKADYKDYLCKGGDCSKFYTICCIGDIHIRRQLFWGHFLTYLP